MTEQWPESTSFDYLILGAGSASIQLAYFLHRAGRDYAVLPVSRRGAEHHVIEDLAAEWREPEHTEPLLRFFREQIEAQAWWTERAAPAQPGMEA